MRPDILLVILRHCPSLQELEIDGRYYGCNMEKTLSQITSLRRIKLIRPSPFFIEVLPEWLESLVDPLQSLSIEYQVDVNFDSHPLQILSQKTILKLTQTSTAFTDALLGQISKTLSGLDELHLAGCQGVTHEGLVSALSHNKNGIKSLTIENIFPLLVRYCSSSFPQ